ncbi:MAG TPA: ATP-binding cassette domain-containing protein [Candidatus Dormibacteraeota bacterium]|nr:ATP-binding cassette domain-containing protein [Candidatus Dormibacteraeota bacterium]
MISEIRAEDVVVSIGPRTILDRVGLLAQAGEVVGVTGPSGSGKTTLMMVLAGLQAPDRGRVLLDGRPVSPRSEPVGIILQNHGLVSILTAAENVALPLQARRLPAAEAEARTRAALHAVGLDEVAEHLCEDLSGGQRQRVGVARALAADPELLIADEPTSELAAEARHLVLGLLREHASRGRIVIVASHDQEVVDACDRCLRLIDGRPAPDPD